MQKILKKSQVQKLKKVFAANNEVRAVYAFGSRTAEFSNSNSDLDMAILVSDRKKISEREIIKFLQKQGVRIPFNLDLSCVDLASPPLFLYQIIKNGVCLYEKNPRQRTSLEATILSIYYDNQHLRNIYHHYLQKSLKEGTYGY